MKTDEERGKVDSVDAYALQLPDLYGNGIPAGSIGEFNRHALRTMREKVRTALDRGRVPLAVGKRELKTIRGMLTALADAGPDEVVVAIIAEPWPVGPDRTKVKSKRRATREARKRNRPKKRRR